MAQVPAEMPSGIVTFVFTDIQGSTRLLRRLGASYEAVLIQHRSILRRCWTEHGGYEVSTEGDAFFVAFGDAADAIAASIAAQRALQAETWQDGIQLRVRIGIHSGLASPTHGDYVALAVHQAKRLVDAGHGGQVLVSQQAAAALAEAHFELRPLGRFRVRDFPEPVRIFQVIADGLADDFPAVRAIPADGHNIVRPPTATIGRGEAISALVAEVAAGRVLTLLGPGGVGKSRLAAEVGIAVAPGWPDGVWFVDLSGVGDPDLVAGAVASAIGVPSDPAGGRTNDVLRHLESRTAVVILDNCEQVAEGCRDLIEAVRRACDGVALLATSREPLRAAGEVLWPVAPLPAPADSEAATVLASPAGRLFSERAAAVRPGFEVDSTNAGAIAEICRHLDGLPLLIELAAAHASHQSPAEILDGLRDRFQLLRSRDPRASDRHRTVEALLDWSCRLLRPAERTALRRLSLFATTFSRTTGTAAVAAGEMDPGEVSDLIWSLVDSSLVSAEMSVGATRYHMLETVRSYARRQLDAADETGTVALHLARWFADRIGPWIAPDRAWVSEMEVEVDNLRALIPLIPRHEQEVAEQLAVSIGKYHDAIGTYREGIDELTRLAADLEHPSPSKVALLTTLGYLYLRTGQSDRASDLVAAAEAVADEHGLPPWDDAGIERTRGDVRLRGGDPIGAVAIARRALERPLSDGGRARMYNLLGISSAAAGDFATAYEACQRELDLNQALGLDVFVASAHGNLAEAALRLGDLGAAARHQGACLDLALAQGSPAMVAFSLIVAARIVAHRGDWHSAGLLHTRAEMLLDEIGLVLYADDQRESERLMTEVRSRLGEDGFAASVGEGRRLGISAAAERAKEILASGAR